MRTFPEFYDPSRVGSLTMARTSLAAAAGLARGGSPAAEDRQRTLLLLVDPQVDFIHEDGALSVPGAVEDTRRTIEWIFSHLDSITSIAASLDSHLPQQIFYPTWWVDEEGGHPDPFTLIRPEDISARRWLPLIDPDWSESYVTELHSQARKELMIWPYHTMIGTPGHAISPALHEAISFHATARQSPPRFVTKGTLPQTEYYSLLEPEVKGEAGGELNRELLYWMLEFDRIFVAGQAKSHCVLETLNSIARNNREQLGKFHLLTDCTSSVPHPQVDFEALAQVALSGLERQGLKLIASETPLV